MLIFYSDTYHFPLPERHHFPMEKYRLVREKLANCKFSDSLELSLPPAATDAQLLSVHKREYLEKLRSGNLSRVEQRKIGFPWSPEMVERHRRSTGATLAAARAALRDGAAAHLAGGTHHGFPDRGEGFCVFNDVAVSARVLLAEQLINQAIVIDLDVHQGNGTAAIFANDPSVFTFSMHGERNYPIEKSGSDLDMQLTDGTGDDEYLESLHMALSERLPLAGSDLVFYLAGADCYQHDRYGRLAMTKAGIRERDRLVFATCRHHDLPVVVVMAGGYAKEVTDVVDINVTTIAELVKSQS